jgi:hypothetical protein
VLEFGARPVPGIPNKEMNYFYYLHHVACITIKEGIKTLNMFNCNATNGFID